MRVKFGILSLDQLEDFKNHPFKVEMNTEFFQQKTSLYACWNELKFCVTIYLISEGMCISVKLTMLGTGHALVTECYNTCFVLSENREGIRYDLVMLCKELVKVI